MNRSSFASSQLVVGCMLLCLIGCSTRVEESPLADPDANPQVWTPSEPAIQYLPLEASEGLSQAVVVQGYPLVHTTQILPVDRDGNLVGEGSDDQQVHQVLSNLKTVLMSSGSDLDQLVRLNIGADSPETIQRVREQLTQWLDPAVRPAISAVLTDLPLANAHVAVDAVATTSEREQVVRMRRCEAVAGRETCADFAVLPNGGVAYLSGQAEKGTLAEATVNSLQALLELVDELQLTRSDVIQLKVFIDEISGSSTVIDQIVPLFPNQLVPPIVFVEWIASAPVEIEMIVRLPLNGGNGVAPVRHYNPPGIKASPTFSRAALVQTDAQVYVSGLTARSAGNGEVQTRDVFQQLEQILAATGSDLNHLAKATYYVADDDVSNMLNALRPEYYDPKRPPAASKAMVHGVGVADRSLAMDMIAVPSAHP